MIIFGVGCITFKYVEQSKLYDNDFSIKEFKHDLISALEAVENVSNIRYFGDDGDWVGFRSFEADEDGDIIPIPVGLHIEFDIYVPFKIQPSLTSELDAEHFHVTIAYGYDRPVAICSYDWNSSFEEANPSMAVSVIRKFLATRITGALNCDAIGPSTFHADFFVDPEAFPDPILVDQSYSFGGYGKFSWRCPNPDDGIVSFLSVNLETFSQFYYLSTKRSVLMNLRSDILMNVSSLLYHKKHHF